MQLALKSIQNFTTSDLKTLIDETCRLELAGVNSFMQAKAKVNINAVRDDSEIVDRKT